MMFYLILVIVFIVYAGLKISKIGNNKFWKLVHQFPDEAYEFFLASKYWHIFNEKPKNGYRKNLPEGDWTGPFKLVVPKLNSRMVTLYGIFSELEKSQEEFMKRYRTQKF